MEPPAGDREAFADEKTRILTSITPLTPTSSCFASSTANVRGRRRRRLDRGYLPAVELPRIVALERLPFYIRAGKPSAHR